MKVFELDPADDAAVAAYAAFVADLQPLWAPEGIRVPEAYTVTELRIHAADVRKHTFVACGDDGAVVGVAEMQWWEAPDNRNRAWLHFDVRDDACLDDLLAAVTPVALAAERLLLNVEAPEGSGVSAWLGRLGAKLGSVEQHNVARLASLDRADVSSLATTTPDGYELIVFSGPAPEEIVEPYARLAHSMNDAPRDDLTMEDWIVTPERLRTWEAGIAARGRDVWTVLARHVESGELVAYNQLVIRPEWPEVVENEDTTVTRAHRGHGIGLWIKAANLLRVLSERPQAVCVETWNAASNEHMLRVNRRLGFVCEHVWESWELTVG